MTTEVELGPDGQPIVDDNNTPPKETPKEQPKVDVTIGDADDKTKLTAEEAVEYAETGDPALDMCLSFLGGVGIKQDDPAMVKATEGDFTLLEAKLAALGDKAKGWERHLALGKSAYERMDKESKATADKVSEAVVGVFGDAETWATVREWAGKNADASEKEAINAMFAAGPVQARAAAIMLRDAYASAPGTKVAPKAAAKEASGGKSTDTNGALSPKEYVAEVNKLHAKLGNRMDDSQEYRQLQARRAAYRG